MKEYGLLDRLIEIDKLMDETKEMLYRSKDDEVISMLCHFLIEDVDMKKKCKQELDTALRLKGYRYKGTPKS